MTVPGGRLLGRQAEAIAREVFWEPEHVADRLLATLRVQLVVTGKPNDVPRPTAARIRDLAARLAETAEVA